MTDRAPAERAPGQQVSSHGGAQTAWRTDSVASRLGRCAAGIAAACGRLQTAGCAERPRIARARPGLPQFWRELPPGPYPGAASKCRLRQLGAMRAPSVGFSTPDAASSGLTSVLRAQPSRRVGISPGPYPAAPPSAAPLTTVPVPAGSSVGAGGRSRLRSGNLWETPQGCRSERGDPSCRSGQPASAIGFPELAQIHS